MKKILSLVLAAVLVLSLSVVAFAADPALATGSVYNGDGKVLGASDNVTVTGPATSNVTVSIDPARPAATYYICLGQMTDKVTLDDDNDAVVENLTNSDYFKMKTEKDEGSKYIESIKLSTDKKLDGNTGRGAFIVIKVKDSTTTTDLKATGSVTFTAKDAAAAYDDTSKEVNTTDNTWTADAAYTVNYRFWINNVGVKGEDGEADAGDRVYFDPASNEDNVFVWGDDRAALEFSATDNAGDFYCRLSTASNSDIYTTYADPISADLWFYDFVGKATIPTTSRATLTLGLPWEEDEGPDPIDCYIYKLEDDGTLVDVTDDFTYSDEDAAIPGWSTKTRTLGTFILSDSELDIEVADDDTSSDDASVPSTDGDKVIPNTGSSDMVSVAVVAAVVSLAAAGAVAFKKVK